MNMAAPMRGGLRVAAICGSIKPLFSGTDDYHERLLQALAEAGADPIEINIRDWRLQRGGALLKAVSAARPDVILLQYPTDAFGRSLLPQLFATVQHVAPLAVTLHEFTAAHPLRRLALTPILLRAGAVVMTAQREVDGLLSSYSWLKPRTHVIPLGNTFPPREWQPEQPPSIVYFGQIRPNKGIESFLACRDELVAAFPSTQFSIIGSRVPQFSAYYSEIAAAAASRNVNLLSGLSEDDVSAALARAQCALLPFPDGASFRRTSLLAAAACGTPIVTLAGSDTPAELTRLLHAVPAPEHLAGMVATLLTDEVARGLAHECSLQVAARVSWKTIAGLYLNVLGALPARSLSGRPPLPSRRQAIEDTRPIVSRANGPVHARNLIEPEPAESAGRQLKVLVVAFSARNAFEQLLDELVTGLSPHMDCRAMVPTNYRGTLPEDILLRVRCGVTKAGGLLAGINPVAHGQVLAGLRRFRPDVIHMLSGEGYPWAVTLVAAARLAGIPFVLSMNDPDPHPGSFFEKLNAVLRKPVLASTAVFHLYSVQHSKRMRELIPSARIMIIEFGSLAGPFLQHRQPGISREKLVLFFGRIQYYKGIDVLCRAMQQMASDVRLAIAGPGIFGADDMALINTLGDRVELHNDYLDNAQVAYLMQRAGVLALPYRHATQSAVPGIATAFGVPLVASALGHFVQEIPALGGLLVPPEDPAALAAALGQALDGALTPAAPVPTFSDLAPDYLAVYAAAAGASSGGA